MERITAIAALGRKPLPCFSLGQASSRGNQGHQIVGKKFSRWISEGQFTAAGLHQAGFYIFGTLAGKSSQLERSG